MREHTMRAALASLHSGFANHSMNKPRLQATAPWSRSLPTLGKQLTISTQLRLQMAAVQKAVRVCDHNTTRISMQRMCVIPMGTSLPQFAAASLNRSDWIRLRRWVRKFRAGCLPGRLFVRPKEFHESLAADRMFRHHFQRDQRGCRQYDAGAAPE